MHAGVLVMQETCRSCTWVGQEDPRVSEMGHKRGPWGHMWSNVELGCMSCEARMHGVANGTMKSGVMRMGEELGRITNFCEAG